MEPILRDRLLAAFLWIAATPFLLLLFFTLGAACLPNGPTRERLLRDLAGIAAALALGYVLLPIDPFDCLCVVGDDVLVAILGVLALRHAICGPTAGRAALNPRAARRPSKEMPP